MPLSVKTNLLLFTPGPLEVSQRVKEACAQPPLFHRDPAFQDILKNLQKKLLSIFGVDETYFPCLFTSTGHGANEAMIIPSLLNREPLFVTNGSWGDALITMARRHRRNIRVLECDRNRKINSRDLESCLDRRKEADTLVIVHQETRSGILNPLAEIAAVAKKHSMRLVVDAISSVVIEEINFRELDVSFFSCSSTKGLRSLPGIGIVCGKKEELEKLKGPGVDSYYFDLYGEYRSQYYEKKLRFAQSTPLFYALAEATDELLEEGAEKRRSLIQQRTKEFREWAKVNQLRFAYPESELGHVTTTFILPDGLSYRAFRDELLNRGIYLLYGDSESGNQFQVCLAGALEEKDIQHLKQSLIGVLEKFFQNRTNLLE